MGTLDTLNIKTSQLRRNLLPVVMRNTYMMTVEATCPTGWTEDSDFVDRYPLGASSDLGTTGGSEDYLHYHESELSVSGKKGIRNATLTYSENATPTWYPPFFKVRFCVKD